MMTNPNPGEVRRISPGKPSILLNQLNTIYNYIMLVEKGKDTKEAWNEARLILGLPEE